MGSLQTSPEEPAAVRTIARAVGGWIDRLGAVWVEGQVSQVNRRQGMSLVFLTLRDTLADLSMTVTCPRVVFDSMNPPLVEGASVLVHGKISYYPNRGTLSLEARELRAVGLGELLARLERLRQTLAAEGLFAREAKRPLPFLPGRIGLVTSPGSAAERDVVEVARRRWAGVDIVTSPAAMQGPRSAGEVIAALQRLDADPGVEVIVIARGGGSVEDLLPFSDEELIRAVSAATTPVVSAIGHEPDSPLLDLVADVRAATPTEAAKIVVPDMSEEARRLGEARDRLRSGVRRAVEREQHALDAIRSRPVLRDPRTMVAERVEETRALTERARRSLEIRLDRGHDDLDHQRARVRALSPLATLQRGYAVLQDADGAVVTSVRGVDPGAALAVRLADGRVHTTAARTEPLEAGPDE